MRLPSDEKDAATLAYLVAIRAELMHIDMPQQERTEVFQSAIRNKEGLSTTRDVLREITSQRKSADISFANQDPDAIRRMRELLQGSNPAPAD